MSATYPELPYTQFPDEIDTINNFVDIALDTLPLAKEYATKYQAGDIAGANAILEANPNLKYSYVGASTLNPIVDAIKAMQMFYAQDVQQYLMNIVKYKGDYSSVTKYSKYDVVKYVNASALESYMCINSNTPISTLPTNSTYWIPLTLRGEKGATGIGLAPHGAWNSITTYPINAMVSYNNILWGSLASNTNVIPSTTNSTTWFKVMEFTSDYMTYTDNTTQAQYKQLVDNNNIYLENVTNQSRIEIAKKSDIPTSLPADGGNASTVNNKTVESNVPSDAKFTDTIYEHPTTSGNIHLPSGGNIGQILKNSANGTGVWGNFTNVVTGTLTVANWTGTSAPYLQDLTVSGVTTSNNVVFDIGMGVTSTQLDSAIEAKLKATSQTTNKVTIKAFGDKPTMNIPVQFLIIG